MMGWHDGGPGWAGWFVMATTMLAFWAVLIFGGLAVLRAMRRDGAGGPSGTRDAERVLDERFARGEIDADEYTQRRDLLRSGR